MSKNTRNRILLTALAALLLVTLTIGGTIAWLTDKTDTVMNTFKPVHIDIELTETLPEGKTAKMIPGAEIDKDPKVTVKANSEACWVFVKVETSGDLSHLSYSINSTNWTELTSKAGNNYKVYYKQLDATTADVELEILTGNKVTVSNQLKNSTMPDSNATMTFTAYAIQQASFTDVALAWDEVSANNEQYVVTTTQTPADGE